MPEDRTYRIARVLALAGLAADRVRPPPNDGWARAEWERRVLECIPGAEEAHCRATAEQIMTVGLVADGDEIEAAAERIWQAESLRATGRHRRISWAEEGDGERERFRGYARASLPFPAMVAPIEPEHPLGPGARAGMAWPDEPDPAGLASVSPACLRGRADLIRDRLDDCGSTARYLELAARQIEALEGKTRPAARVAVMIESGRRYLQMAEIDGRFGHLMPGRYDLFLSPLAADHFGEVNKMVHDPLSIVADALECFWNASIGSAQRSQDATALAIAGSLSEGFAAIAVRLREGAR
ncbi:MAG: hypothetical protein DI527_00600 [Chelatococcus sp.]|nr:MAG: hypothetical protein DI527_00600 [Chelatococcus sp.]